MKHTISVITPVYNDPIGISVTLDSLLALRTTDRYEVVVVDNGSTDTTLDRIQNHSSENPNIRWFREIEVQGSYAARNTGIEHAEGDVLSFLDDSVRTLEAVETLADVDGRDDVANDARQKRQRLL